MQEKRIKEVLEKEFGLEQTAVVLIRESADNFMYKVSSFGKDFALRISKRDNLLLGDVMFELEVIEIANSKGVKTATIIRNKNGDPVTVNEGNLFVLFDFAVGIHVESSTEASPGIHKVYNAGKALAELHTAWEGYVPTHKKTRDMFTEYQRFFELKDMFIKDFSNGKEIYDRAKDLYDEFVKQDVSNIIHNDYRPGNVFFGENNDEVSAVIDFDWACQGNFLKDLAHAVVEWSTPDGFEGVRLDIAQAFLDGYVSVRKIKTDIGHFKKWMEFSCIADALTYWVDSKDELERSGPLRSYMLGKANKVANGLFDSLTL